MKDMFPERYVFENIESKAITNEKWEIIELKNIMIHLIS